MVMWAVCEHVGYFAIIQECWWLIGIQSRLKSSHIDVVGVVSSVGFSIFLTFSSRMNDIACCAVNLNMHEGVPIYDKARGAYSRLYEYANSEERNNQILIPSLTPTHAVDKQAAFSSEFKFRYQMIDIYLNQNQIILFFQCLTNKTHCD